MVVQLSKTGGQASGTTFSYSDTSAPFDCAVIPQTAPLTLTPLAIDHDEDADGCTDYRELGPDQTAGGLRDPFNPYDYYDVNHDGYINVFDDILVVAGAFGPGDPAYIDYKDRGAVNPGPYSWNKGPPDGEVNVVDDINGVAAQFGHACPHAAKQPVTTAFGAHPTTLSAKVTSGQPAPFALSVNTTAGHASSGQLLVEEETLTYNQGGGCSGLNAATQFCVTGRGTTPAQHAVSAIVYPKP